MTATPSTVRINKCACYDEHWTYECRHLSQDKREHHNPFEVTVRFMVYAPSQAAAEHDTADWLRMAHAHIDSLDVRWQEFIAGSARKAMTVRGSSGALLVDWNSGQVLGVEPSTSEYAGITRFDLAEWRTWYTGNTIVGPEYGNRPILEYDILDIGYWERNDEGVEIYEKASEDHRSRNWY